MTTERIGEILILTFGEVEMAIFDKIQYYSVSKCALYEFFKKINKFLLIYTMYLPLNWNFTTPSLSLMHLHCQPKTDRKSYSEIVTTAFSTTLS